MRTARVLHLATLGALAISSSARPPTAPRRLPIHFDGAGRPDRWSGGALAWFGPVLVAIALNALFLALERLRARGRRS